MKLIDNGLIYSYDWFIVKLICFSKYFDKYLPFISDVVSSVECCFPVKEKENKNHILESVQECFGKKAQDIINVEGHLFNVKEVIWRSHINYIVNYTYYAYNLFLELLNTWLLWTESFWIATKWLFTIIFNGQIIVSVAFFPLQMLLITNLLIGWNAQVFTIQENMMAIETFSFMCNFFISSANILR